LEVLLQLVTLPELSPIGGVVPRPQPVSQIRPQITAAVNTNRLFDLKISLCMNARELAAKMKIMFFD
jgi:hypothetical protein